MNRINQVIKSYIDRGVVLTPEMLEVFAIRAKLLTIEPMTAEWCGLAEKAASLFPETVQKMEDIEAAIDLED